MYKSVTKSLPVFACLEKTFFAGRGLESSRHSLLANRVSGYEIMTFTEPVMVIYSLFIPFPFSLCSCFFPFCLVVAFFYDFSHHTGFPFSVSYYMVYLHCHCHFFFFIFFFLCFSN